MQEAGMLLKWLREEQTFLGAYLAALRTAGDTLAEKVARIMGDETRTTNYRTEGAAKLREDTYREQMDRFVALNVAGRLDEVAKRAGTYTRSLAVRQARFTPECVLWAEFSPGEKRMATGLAAIAESLERIRWGQDLERMDEEELKATLNIAKDTGSLAILGALIREARRRAQLPGGDDMLAVRMEGELRAWPIPELDEMEAAFRQVGLLGQWIDEARTALQTGEDAGRARQIIVEAQQRGASKDEIREALARFNAAA